MSEQSKPATAGSTGQLRTLAVRITEELRAQLDIIAQLTGRTATEEIRLAIEHWIDKSKADPAVLKKAAAVRAEIERDAQTRRNAIEAIFATEGTKGQAPTSSTGAGAARPAKPPSTPPA
jgi:predicted transcriptional regulator